MKCYFKALSKEILLEDFTALQMTAGEEFITNDQYTMIYHGEAPGDPGFHYLGVETSDSAFMYDLLAKAFFAGTQRVTSNPNYESPGVDVLLQEVDLELYKQKAYDSIDYSASQIRQAVASKYPDQYFVYDAKEFQAKLFVDDLAPTPEKYPYIYGEVGATADTAEEVAVVILTMAQAWKALGPLTESIRIKGKAAVRRANTPAEVNAALDSITWPQVG